MVGFLSRASSEEVGGCLRRRVGDSVRGVVVLQKKVARVGLVVFWRWGPHLWVLGGGLCKRFEKGGVVGRRVMKRVSVAATKRIRWMRICWAEKVDIVQGVEDFDWPSRRRDQGA